MRHGKGPGFFYLRRKDRMKTKRIALVFACILFAGVSCLNPVEKVIQQFNKPPDISAFTRAVKVCLPLGYAAQIAMDAVNGKIAPGVTVTPKPDSFPFTAIVRIPVDRSHPLPAGSDTVNGSLMVAGLFSDSNTALVSVFFTQTNVHDGTFLVKDVAFVPVVRDTLGTMVVFASEDVNMDSSLVINTKLTDSLLSVKLKGVPTTLPTDSSLAVSQKAWITLVSRQAGAAVGSEAYTLYGASQYMGVTPSTTEVIQAVFVAVSLKPSACRRNPSAGYAMIQDIKVQESGHSSNTDMGTTLLTFGNSCPATPPFPLPLGYIWRG